MNSSKINKLYELPNSEKKVLESIPEQSARNFLKRLINFLNDSKAEEIVLVIPKNKFTYTDYLIICQGRSHLHCRSIVQNVNYNMKKEGAISFSIEGEREGNWSLLDYGEVILHVFHPEIRKYYNLEELFTS